MFPNLLQATIDYWQKLDALEAAHRRGEVSIADVDAQVAQLIAELGQERHVALQFCLSGLNRVWQEQRETAVGIALLGILTYAWVVVS